MSIKLEDYIGKAALLEQTAEEAVELAHACLKMARKIRGENLTPKTEQECLDALVEESADVYVCLCQLVDESGVFSHEALDSVIAAKELRMENRIKQFEKGCIEVEEPKFL